MRYLRNVAILTILCFPAAGLAQGPDFSGRWQISILPSSARELPLWILELAQSGGAYTGRFIAKSIPGPDVPEALKVVEDRIEFKVRSGNFTIEFKGKLEAGTITGIADDQTQPLKFTGTRTTKSVLDDPLAEGRAYQAALSLKDPQKKIEALEKFIRTYPQSRMIAASLAHMLEAALLVQPDDAELTRTLDRFLTEFEKLPALNEAGRFAVYRDAAHTLATRGRLLERATELADRAAKILGNNPPAEMRSTLLVTQALLARHNNRLDKAEQLLRQSLADNAQNTEATLELARLYQSQGQNAKAGELYLTAYAQSGSSETLRSLEEVFRKAHGSLESLHEAIDRATLARPRPFDAGKHTAASASGKVVLAELFTGSECGPCFAADNAFDGLLERFDRASLAVLEYHLHIPRPDPMTNRDAEERGEYYSVISTPTTLFEGTSRVPSGGGAAVVERVFHSFREEVEKALAEQPAYQITLTANRQGDTVAVQVGLQLLADVAGSKHRLRVALLEDPVHYTGYNKVHFHRYVVRKMLGGADGRQIKLVDRKQQVTDTVDLADLEQSLKKYADDYERDTSVKFSERTQVIDRGNLSVAAFVQDDATKRILQAAVVKVN